MFGIDLATWALMREGGSGLLLLGFLAFFSKSYLKSVARIADEVTTSTSQHIQALTQVKDALTALTIQVMRNTDAVVRCKGSDDKGDNNERQ